MPGVVSVPSRRWAELGWFESYLDISWGQGPQPRGEGEERGHCHARASALQDPVLRWVQPGPGLPLLPQPLGIWGKGP